MLTIRKKKVQQKNIKIIIIIDKVKWKKSIVLIWILVKLIVVEIVK